MVSRGGVFLCRVVAVATRRGMLVFPMVLVWSVCLDLPYICKACIVTAINQNGTPPGERRGGDN